MHKINQLRAYGAGRSKAVSVIEALGSSKPLITRLSND